MNVIFVCPSRCTMRVLSVLAFVLAALLPALAFSTIAFPTSAEARVARSVDELADVFRRRSRAGARATRELSDETLELARRQGGAGFAEFRRFVMRAGGERARAIIETIDTMPVARRAAALEFVAAHGHRPTTLENLKRFGAEGIETYLRHGRARGDFMLAEHGATAARSLSRITEGQGRALAGYQPEVDRLSAAGREDLFRRLGDNPSETLQQLHQARLDPTLIRNGILIAGATVGGTMVLMEHGDEIVGAAESVGVSAIETTGSVATTAVENAGELGTTAIEVSGDTIRSPLNMLATAAGLIGALLALIYFAPTFIRRFRAVKKPAPSSPVPGDASSPPAEQKVQD